MRRVPGSCPFLSISTLTRGFAALLLVAGIAACDDPGPTAPDDDDTAAPVFTETFTGSLNPNGALTFPFTALASGTATATVAAMLPNTVAMGFAMGTWNGTSCQAVITNDNAIEFSQIIGSIGSAGTLCLRVYDIGRLTTTTKFVITVVHP